MQLLLLSNSRQAGMGYLEHADGFLRAFLPSGIRQVLFVPYAAITKTHYEFVDEVRPAFARLGAEVIGIHRAHDPVQAVREAQAIVVGGGNTWNLLREMRGHRLLPATDPPPPPLLWRLRRRSGRRCTDRFAPCGCTVPR